MARNSHHSLTYRLTGAVLLALGLPAVGLAADAEPPPWHQVQNANLAGLSPAVAAAYTRFGLKLYRQTARGKTDTNVSISPLSVGMALDMVLNGARGETKEAMSRALEVKGLSLADLNAANAAMLSGGGDTGGQGPFAEMAAKETRVRTTIANAVWAHKGERLNPRFAATCRRQYHAGLAVLDFDSPKALEAINGWTKRHTEGMIPSILESLDSGTSFVLTNALYFKGSWSQPFDPKQTKDAPFTLADGSRRNVPMMTRAGHFNHLRGDGFEAVSLPYGETGLVSFCVFLPDAGVPLDALIQRLDAGDWETWANQLENEAGTVSLPRFKLEYTAELSAALTALGMGVAFTGRADFGDMSGPPLWISEVQHKTAVEVNEEGTEAAAATAISMSRGIDMNPRPPFRFVADRPFLFAIRDSATGLVLFLGSVADPK